LEASEAGLIAPRLAETRAALQAEDPGMAVVFADTFLLDRAPAQVMQMLKDTGE
jgi:hypothetical protein